MKSERRQVGGRYLARARGAFSRPDVRPRRKVVPMANPEPDGAPQASWALRARKFPLLPPVAAATIQGPVFEGAGRG
jgi:hypothetical protein